MVGFDVLGQIMEKIPLLPSPNVAIILLKRSPK
jgi:hypothetical protein